MDSIRLLHLADTHLGKRHSDFASRDGRNILSIDIEDQFKHCLNLAVEKEVDAVINAGDMYDRTNLSNTELKAGLNALSITSAANIPYVTITGNHDRPFTKGVTSPVELVDLVDQCHAIPRVGTKTLEIGDSSLAIYGISYLKRDVRNNYPKVLDNLLQDHGDYNIVLSHQSVEGIQTGFELSRTNEPMVPRSIFPTDLDYVAMGHIHRRQTLHHRMNPDLAIHYPGNAVKMNFGERDYKNAVSLVEISDDGVNIEEIPLQTREFREVIVELDNPDSIDAETRITESIRANDEEGIFLGVRLQGEMRIALKSITMTNRYYDPLDTDLVGFRIYNNDKNMVWLDDRGQRLTAGSEWQKSAYDELQEVLDDEDGLSDEKKQRLLKLGNEIIDNHRGA